MPIKPLPKNLFILVSEQTAAIDQGFSRPTNLFFPNRKPMAF